MRVLALLLSLLAPVAAHAHGGLPLSQGLLRSTGDQRYYIPVAFWGLWIGQQGQPWVWICEEVINLNRTRSFALSTDGTFYVTDINGLEISTDHGCSWPAATGEVASLRIADVAADVSDPATAWAVSADGNAVGDGGLPGNALFVTHDHGGTFTRTVGLGASNRLLLSVKQSPTNAQVIYVTSIYGPGPFDAAIHRSPDGAQSFTQYSPAPIIDGQPAADLHLLAVDPRDANVIYLRAQVTFVGDMQLIARQALLRSTDGGQTLSTLWEMDGTTTSSGTSRGIDGVAIDVARGKVYVATAGGLLSGDDAGSAPSVTLAPIGNLSQAQCVDVFNGNVFACANNYAPDSAALAQSTDGAQTFTSILRFSDTKGPVDCPAGTPVGDQCPYYWLTYGEQLGILSPSIDGGADMGTTPPSGCACDTSGAGGFSLAPLALLLFIALRVRRQTP